MVLGIDSSVFMFLSIIFGGETGDAFERTDFFLRNRAIDWLCMAALALLLIVTSSHETLCEKHLCGGLYNFMKWLHKDYNIAVHIHVSSLEEQNTSS
jgi:hypothetical protein